MKKTLLFSALALLAGASFTQANAETMTGTVTDVKGNMVTIQGKDGSEKVMKTTENTKYREKKIIKKDKMKQGKKLKKGDSFYKPLVDEDEWVEVVYTVDEDGDIYYLEDVIVYDD
jgi:hypothetical protein